MIKKNVNLFLVIFINKNFKKLKKSSIKNTEKLYENNLKLNLIKLKKLHGNFKFT